MKSSASELGLSIDKSVEDARAQHIFQPIWRSVREKEK